MPIAWPDLRFVSTGEQHKDYVPEKVPSTVWPDLDWSPNENWVDEEGDLPNYIARTAKHFVYEKGWSRGRAVATAADFADYVCRTGDLWFPGEQTVNAGSRRQACQASKDWQSMTHKPITNRAGGGR